jgi:CheY-like chemotaxis protein
LNTDACKVLVVDDDRDNADTTAMLLQMWGHEAEAAYSADDSISKAVALDPDVILLDIGMPGKNGIDLAGELRAFCPDAKLLALTGFTQADIVRRARDAGFSDVLFKPAPARVLKEAVDGECAAAHPKAPLTARRR